MPPLDMPPGSPFGPGITALVVYLHTQQFVSYNRMAEMLKGVFGLDISQGAIANMLARAGKPFARQAKDIAEVVRTSAVVSSDETSARVQGKTWWQWMFGSATAVSHRIADARGAIAVTEALAGARPEVWVSDRYSAQRGHGVLHQARLAHLLRDAQYAIDSGDWWFALAFKALLKRAIGIAVAACRGGNKPGAGGARR
jgi:transposase